MPVKRCSADMLLWANARVLVVALTCCKDVSLQSSSRAVHKDMEHKPHPTTWYSVLRILAGRHMNIRLSVSKCHTHDWFHLLVLPQNEMVVLTHHGR